MINFSILNSLNLQCPAVSQLNSTDYTLVVSYLQYKEYSTMFNYLSNQEWYEAVHTFLLLVCEAEGI